MAPVEKSFQRAVAAHQGGQRHQARALYEEILERNPQFANAWQMLGMLAFEEQAYDLALQYVEKAVELDDRNPYFFNNLGLVLRRMGRHPAAESAFRQSLRLQGPNAETLGNLGLVLVELRRMAEAKQTLEQSLALDPRNNQTFNSLGIANEHLGDLPEAERCYRQALAIDASDHNASANLGVVLTRLGRLDEAVVHHRRAIELTPQSFKAWTNYAHALSSLGKLDEAVACHEQALRLSPESAPIWNNLGSSLKEQGRLGEAADAFRKSLEILPDAATHSNLLLCQIYDATIEPLELIAEHRLWGQLYGRPVDQIAPHSNSPDPDRPLRIGYVSADFRSHAVARFIEPVLAHHDHRRYEPFCYANVPYPDATTRRMQSYVPNWRSIYRLDDDQVERRIRDDAIDILVDLSGHTALNRLPIFGRKPAPIQVTCIGYPVTTGLTTIDYRLTDEVLNPSHEPSFDAEQLWRSPVGSACFFPDEGAPPVGPLPALRNGHLTFGSPHNRAKLNDAVLETWAAILRAIPDSRLLMFRGGLDGETAKSLHATFAAHGVAPDRIDIRNVSSGTHGYSGYMAIYQEIDVCLDTFPGNAGTTACESAWMGVPMLTLYGERFFGRQTACLLSRLGIPEWTVSSTTQYVEAARSWNERRTELARLRSNLRQLFRDSPLGDAEKYTRGLEDDYRQMWRRWCGRV